MDFERTINLANAAKDDVSILKDEVIRALIELESEKLTGKDFGPEIVRIGLALSLAINGPVSTLTMLFDLLMEGSNSMPGSWQAARARLTCEGTA